MKKVVQLDDRRLRAKVVRQPPAPRSEPVPLPTFRGRGLQPGVNLDSSESLLDRMESAGDPD